MERHGINLNGYHQVAWQRRSLNAAVQLLICMLLSLLAATLVQFMVVERAEQSQLAQLQQQQLRQQMDELDNKIARFKQDYRANSSLQPFDKQSLNAIFAFLADLPLNGELESVQLEQAESISIYLNGTSDPNRFEQFELALKQQGITYKMLNLQTNEKQQLAFHLQIIWGQQNAHSAR